MASKQKAKCSTRSQAEISEHVITHDTRPISDIESDSINFKTGNKAIGQSWDEYEKEIFTPEEIEELDKRAALLLAKIDRRKPKKK